ncbi:transporter, major facilitator family protein [Toxoplasma gondii RUB]|uniref:Transporter, major facilitator family protein n=1 Tax=Toxoplasma gondii RUB TaxID=935652 RepID=A0A086LTY2_TOXGO|nr:transporter, major facilitator family protein [Toxoplasma gondii RUB]
MSSLLTACLCATLDSLLTGQIISLLQTDIMMKEEAPGPSPALVPSAEFAEELQTSGSFDREKQEQRNVTPFRRGSPWNFWSSALYHCGGRRARKGIVILGSCLVMLGLSSSLSWSCTYPYMFAYLQHAGSTWQYRHCAWVSVMQLAGLLMTLPLGSMLETRIGPRWTVCLGALIGFSGSFGVSFAVGSYWAILFLYGLVQGMGAGLQMAPASTVPLRWQPDKVNLLLNLRCTAFMLGPCIFIPMNILGADYSSTPTTIHSVSDNMRSDSGTVTGQQQLVTSQAYLSFPSWGPSILQAVAGVTLALQLCGGVLLDNPPWTQRWQRRHVNEGQKERKPASPVTPSVETSIHSCVADSSDVKKPASQHQPRAAVTNRLLPGESISGFVTRCSTLRQAYLAHFIVPFTVSDVSGMTKRLDELFIQKRSVPSWARGLHGISLSLGESLRTTRFFFLCFVSCCHFFYFVSLYTYWHVAAVSFSIPQSKLLFISIMLSIFAVLCCLYWGEYIRVFTVGTGLVMTSSLCCASSWLFGMAASSSQAAFTIAVALCIFSAVGVVALVAQGAATAFGPRPLGFVLYLLQSCAIIGGAVLSGVTALFFLDGSHLSFTRFAILPAILLTIISSALVAVRCFFRGKLTLLDAPVRRRCTEVEADEDGETSQSPHDERIDLESSDDAYTDDETRPLNLAAVIREYQESAQRRHSAKTEEAILSETEGYHDADSPLQFPVGVDPAHIFPAEEDWDEAELSLSSAEETDSEQGGSDK